MTASESGTSTSAAPKSPSDKPLVPAQPQAANVPARRGPKLVILAVILAGCAIAGAWVAMGPAASVGTTISPDRIATVSRGPLVYSVTESGEVQAEQRRVIGNELRYPAIIKQVVPEGTSVKAGDTIIEFECKELLDDIDKGQITVTAAKNAVTQARENLTLKQKEMDAAVRAANIALDNAKKDLKKYLDIEGPTELDDANSAIKTASQDLLLAQAKLDFKLKVNADEELKSPFSQNDIEAEQLGVQKLGLALKKAKNNYRMLKEYDNPRKIQTYQTAVQDADLALARSKLEQRSQLLKAQADLDAAQATFDMQDRQLKDLLEEKNKMKVVADKEGLVVYDSGGSRWYSDDVRVEVGAKINPRQQLMIIPDLTTLQIKTKVYEAIIDDVHPGLKAHVKLENRPDQSFPATVIRVGVLPDSQNRWLNPGVKVFSVVVKLDHEIEGLRPGMSAEVETEIAKLDNVLSVPVASVFTEQGKTFCYKVSDDGSYKRQPVSLGRMNNTQVQILAGLAEGDQVLLTPPAGEQIEYGKPSEDQQDKDADNGQPANAGARKKQRPPRSGDSAKAQPSRSAQPRDKAKGPAAGSGRPKASSGGPRKTR